MQNGKVAGLGGLPLALRDIFNSGAVNLCRIGAVVQPKADDAGHERRQQNANVGQYIKQEIELDEQGRAPDEVCNRRHRFRNKRIYGHPRNRNDKARDARKHRAQQGCQNGDLDPLQQGGADFPDKFPVPFHAALLGSHAIEAARDAALQQAHRP